MSVMTKSDTTTVTFRRQLATLAFGNISAGQTIELPTEDAVRYVRNGLAVEGGTLPAADVEVVEQREAKGTTRPAPDVPATPADRVDDDPDTPRRRTPEASTPAKIDENDPTATGDAKPAKKAAAKKAPAKRTGDAKPAKKAAAKRTATK